MMVLGILTGIGILLCTYVLALEIHKNWQKKQYQKWRKWYELERKREMLYDMVNELIEEM